MFENLAPQATAESTALSDSLTGDDTTDTPTITTASNSAVKGNDEKKSQQVPTADVTIAAAQRVVSGKDRPTMPQVVYSAAISRFILNHFT
jgi:hypothetical protein